MARTIRLKFEGKCSDCGSMLPVGTLAMYYGRGRIYGREGCHESSGTPSKPTREETRPNWTARAAIIDPDVLVDAVKRGMYGLDNPGFCLACGEEADGCEPDARLYECDGCGERAVFGAEELLIMHPEAL